MEGKLENESVKLENHEEKVKVKLENDSVKLENHEEKVKVKLENESVELEKESVVEKLNVKLVIHGSVVQQVDRTPVLLALVEPSTGFCRGIADIVKVEERVRRRATVAGGTRKFHCDSCNYSTKDNYLLKRHIARIHEKIIDSKRCRFCKFSTIYSSNLSRHIQRAHSNQEGSSISCNQASNFSRS